MIRVMIVDDHAGVRQGLVELLSATPDVVVVAECTDGSQTVEAARAQEPDVVLMDLVMPDVGGLDATRMLIAARPSTKVIILSGRLSQTLAAEAYDAGAAGYLLKTGTPEEIVVAIRTVMTGRPAWTPAAARHLTYG